MSALPLLVLLAAQTPLPQTAAERTNFAETTRHADVVAFCDDLAKQFPVVKHLTCGQSGEKRPLPLLVLSDPPVATPLEASKSGKPVVYVQANIHAGEVDGKEAVLALARDLAAAKDRAILKKLVVLVVPNVNPDGNEKVSDKNRTEQAGPKAVGERENAAGLDLNRDFVKLESPEIRAVTKLWTAWDPLLIIDCHTTNGSHHRYTLTYDGPRHPGAGEKLIGYSRGKLLPDVRKRIKTATGYDTFPYGNFDGTRTKWESYPATPRFGLQAAALRGRFGLLSESYSYAPFRDRVNASYAFVKAAFEHVVEHADAMKAATANTGDIVLTSKTVGDAEKATVLGFVEEVKDGKRVRTDAAKDYPVTTYLTMEAVATAKLPAAYFVLPEAEQAVELLQRHGVKVEELREDIDLEVDGFLVRSVKTAERPFQKHRTQTLSVVGTRNVRRVPAGAVVVKTNQPLGRLAAFLLEPTAEDGFATWNVYDPFLNTGAKPLPLFKMTAVPPLALGAVRPLAEDRPAPRAIGVEDLKRGLNLAGNTVGGIAWLDAEHFSQIKDGKTWKVHARTGKTEVLFDEKLLEKSKSAVKELSRAPGRGFGGGFGRGAAAEEPAKPYLLLRAGAEYAVAYYDGKPAEKLTSSGGNKEFATLSPTGKTLAFVRDGNLFSVDVASKKETKLTPDGGADVLNGRGDWVYEEEIFNRNGRAYWWSDTGESLAFLRFDDGPVKKFTLSVPFPARGGTEVLNYPKAGDSNPTVKIGVASPGREKPVYLDLGEYKPEDTVVARVGFVAKSNAVYAYVQNRVQTWLDFVVWDSPTAKPRKLFRDSTRAWIDDAGEPRWLGDGSFLFASERTGWKHVYHYAADGTLKTAVTAGEWEARDLIRVDEKAGVLYVGGTKDGSTKTNLYRVKLDGSETKLLSNPAESHAVSVAPAGGLWVDRTTDLNSPTRVFLRDETGEVVRKLDTNPLYESENYKHCPTERVSIPLADGFVLEGVVIKPAAFDPAKKYPVWLQTYAGPHTPTVRDAWNGGRVYDQALANMGVIVFKVDPRGASGKGAVSAWAGYRKLGVNELKDLEAAVAWLAKNPWVDPARVGLSGHSYGGYITAFALTHSKVFSAGISGAPVTDWRLYDSIYTERFMGLPKENADGYDASSVVKAAANLHGKLLLIHGLADDNVHFQNTAQFIDALQAANKTFEVMIYPRARHGIGGPHYQNLQLDFIRRALDLK